MDHRTLLVVLAHPDDESFPIGGTLAKYASQGVHVSLLCATKGEAGISGISPAEAGRIREKELRSAADILGLSNVHFLDFEDGKLAEVHPDHIISGLEKSLQQFQPHAVITFGPDGISGHSDHTTISSLVTEAFDRAMQNSIISSNALLYYIAPSEATMQGCGVVPALEVAGGPVAAIDIGDYLVTKVQAMQSHASQNPPYPGNPEEEAAKLVCHEYFTLARPTLTDGHWDDLFRI